MGSVISLSRGVALQITRTSMLITRTLVSFKTSTTTFNASGVMCQHGSRRCYFEMHPAFYCQGRYSKMSLNKPSNCEMPLWKYLKTKRSKNRSRGELRARVIRLMNVWGWTQRAVTPQLFRGSRLTGSMLPPLISAIGSNLISPWTLKPASWQWNGLYKPLCENLQGLSVLFLKLLNSTSC